MDRQTVEWWKNELEQGEDYKKKFGDSENWEQYSEWYRANFSKDVLPYNLIFSMARTMIPNTYLRNPYVTVTSDSPGKEAEAAVLEAVLNKLIRVCKIKSTIKKLCLDTFLFGTGIIKTGFNSEFGLVLDETGIQQQKVKKNIEFDTRVTPGMPWALPVHPENVLFPKGYVAENVPWIAFKVYRDLEFIKQDKKYIKSVRESVAPSYKRTGEDEAKFCELIEIHDRETEKVYVFETNGNKFLREDKDYLQVSGLPFISMVFNADPKSLWGTGDAKQLQELQQEMVETKTQQWEHRKLTLIKFLIDKNAIDRKDVDEDFLSGNVGPAIFVEGNPRDAVQTITPNMPQDLELWTRSIRSDARETVGFSRNQMGEFDTSSRRTATEAAAVHRGGEIRIDERRDSVADVLVSLMRTFHIYVKEFWTSEQVVPVLGPDMVWHWISFRGNQLSGEFDFKIDPGSEMPFNKEIRRAEGKELLAMFGNDPMIPNPMLLRKYVLQQYEGLNVEALLTPQQQGSPVGMETLKKAYDNSRLPVS